MANHIYDKLTGKRTKAPGVDRKGMLAADKDGTTYYVENYEETDASVRGVAENEINPDMTMKELRAKQKAIKNFAGMTKTVLKGHAKVAKVKGYTKMSRDELVEALEK